MATSRAIQAAVALLAAATLNAAAPNAAAQDASLEELIARAKKRDAEAEYILGMRAYEGRGVARDPVQSYMWMLLAAGSGDDTANAHKDMVAARLSAAQIVHAGKLARAWRQSRRAVTAPLPPVQ